MSTQTHELQISGMSCQHCVKAVTQAVQQQDPSATVEIQLPQGHARIATQLPREAVVQAIQDEGYVVQH